MIPLDYEGPVQRPFEPWDRRELAAGVITRFLAMADRFGGRLAVSDGQGAWTYAELAAVAGGVQKALLAQQAASPVAITIANSRWLVAAILGALAAGRPYVPLAESQPPARRSRVMAHCGARFTMTREWVEQVPSARLDTDSRVASGVSIAYILYTSGSTGEPKGVFQNQHNLLHDVMQYTHSVHLSSEDRLTLVYPAEAIGSVRDILGSLLNGGSLFVHDLPAEGLGRLTGQLSNGVVTIYHSVPPLFRTVMSQLREPVDGAVRLAYLAGDRVLTSDLDLFTERFGREALFYTGIGCTECSTLYRQWFPRREGVVAGLPLAVGRAIPERHSTLLPDGQIEVTSPYLALGYWGDGASPAARFPESPVEPGARVFRPGDRGKWREDGLLEHLGRADQQVKVRGFRVELNEIEQVMARHTPNVAVVCHDGQLTAVHEGLRRDDWREVLQASLPPHMIPARYLCAEQLPRLANGKLNRPAIAELAMALTGAEGRTPEPPVVHPRPRGNSLEALVCEVFESVLGAGPVDPGADFFAHGGDSLQALQAALELERRTGLAMAINPFATARSPREVARLLSDWGKPRGERDVYYFLPGIDGTASGLAGLLPANGLRNRVQALRYPEDLSLRTIPQMAAWIRQRMPREPGIRQWLLGYSFGGRVAFELARQLTEERHGRVAFLGIIDTLARGAETTAGPRPLPDRLLLGLQLMSRTKPSDWLAAIRYRARRKPPPAESPFVKRNREASASYAPTWWDGEVSLMCRSNETASQADDLGWSAYCRTVRIFPFQGCHNIRNPLNAPGVAAALEKALRQNAGHSRQSPQLGKA